MNRLAIALAVILLSLAAIGGVVVWGSGPATAQAADDAIVWGS